MLVDFKDLAGSSRIWIYQAERAFTEDELVQVRKRIEDFLKVWKRHGDDLKAAYEIRYDQFIILAVDEAHQEVSGCSIDASRYIIQKLEKDFNIDLMNKMNIAFKSGEHINTVSLADFKTYADQKKINADTVVFNNLVETKEAYGNSWEITAGNSWHSRFI